MKNHRSSMPALVVLLVLHWSPRVSAQMAKVAIGYSGISADQLVIWVAKDAGIFAKRTTSMRRRFISPEAQHRSPR
jgi:ABC-type nitrate/sulfonate/bicarbonate transport system substrate-binding protein